MQEQLRLTAVISQLQLKPCKSARSSSGCSLQLHGCVCVCVCPTPRGRGNHTHMDGGSGSAAAATTSTDTTRRGSCTARPDQAETSSAPTETPDHADAPTERPPVRGHLGMTPCKGGRPGQASRHPAAELPPRVRGRIPCLPRPRQPRRCAGSGTSLPWRGSGLVLWCPDRPDAALSRLPKLAAAPRGAARAC